MVRRVCCVLALVGSVLVLPLAKAAFAAGPLTDFNGDGFADLAIGVPFEDVGGVDGAGAVQVLYGSSTGLTSTDQFWTQDSPGVPGSGESGDNFGTFVATGNFNGDGFTDLAIGVPFEDEGPVSNAGAVNVLYGSSLGLTATGAQFWTQDTSGVLDTAEPGDDFGASLAAGDFNGDGRSDLAIGVPFEDVGAAVIAGALNVLYGSSTGLTATGNQIWNQNSPGVPDSAEAFDHFGSSLAAGNFGQGTQADLAIGVEGETVGGFTFAGAVNVLYGSPTGLTGTGSQFWSQNSAGIPDSAEQGDAFGWTLVGANFGRGGQADLAVGVPFEALGGALAAGAVHVLYGSSTGLTATGNQFWTQDSTGVNDVVEQGDVFGWSLGAANFGKSSQADLAVGVPGEGLGIVPGAGAVNVLYGSTTGVTSTADQFWNQDSTGIMDAAEAGDEFGWSLAPRGSGISPD
jgi:FG-GAP repeat